VGHVVARQDVDIVVENVQKDFSPIVFRRVPRVATFRQHACCEDRTLLSFDQDASLRVFSEVDSLFASFRANQFIREVEVALQRGSRPLRDPPGPKDVSISQLLTFNDVAHFSRCFKSPYGVSPLKFRLER
jgi:AraC-like DNA-binding protein